jgi:hypothetical protein
MTPAMLTHPKFLAASLSPAEEGVACPLAGANVRPGEGVGKKESDIVSATVGNMEAVGGGGIANVGNTEDVGTAELDGAIESLSDIVSAIDGAREIDGANDADGTAEIEGANDAVGNGETDGSSDPVPASEPANVGNADALGANVGDSSLIVPRDGGLRTKDRTWGFGKVVP